MTLKPIPINEGLYTGVSPEELVGSEFATIFRNLLINEAGSNIDRPGLNAVAAIGAIIISGAYYWEKFNVVVVVTFSRQVFSVSSGLVVTDITGAANLGGTSRPTFDHDGTYLAIAGGGAPQRWAGSGVCELMPGAPPSTNWVTYLDGYWMLQPLDSQEIRWAGPTAVLRETFSPDNFFSAEGRPDNNISQKLLFREFWVFGTESTEVFQNLGETSVPFRRSFFYNRGVAAPYSVVEADNTLFALDSDKRFIMWQNQTPQIISSPFDRTIKDMATVSDCWGARLDIEGLYLILWAFPTEGRTFVYDYKNKKWSEWTNYHDGTERFFRANCYAFAKYWTASRHLVGSAFDNQLYEMSRTIKSDEGDPIRRVRRTGQVTFGLGVNKRLGYYNFNVSRGLGTPGETEPVFEIRFNDDNGGWTDFIEVGLGFPGEPKGPIRVDAGGIFRERELEIVCTAEVDFVLVGLEADIEPMVS